MSFLRPLAAATVAVLALSSCAQVGGTAATVGDARITDNEVSDASALVAQVVGTEPNQINQGAILQALVRGELADELAARNAITLTNTERDAALAEVTDEAILGLAATPDGKEVAYDLVDFALVAQKLGENGLVNGVKNIKVDVNPRYGTWSAADFAVSPSLGSLSVPGPEANPTAAGR